MAVSHLGLIDWLSYMAARLTAPVPGLGWHRYRLLAVPRTGMPGMPRGYRARVVDSDSLIGRIDAPARTIAYRAAQGMAALAAYKEDHLVGVNWLTGLAFEEDEVAARWVPPPQGAWDTGLWVHPDHRMSRAFAAIWAGTAAWMAERNLDWSYSRIADYNLASLAPHVRMGGVEIGTASFARLGPTQFASRGQGRLSATRPTLIRLDLPR